MRDDTRRVLIIDPDPLFAKKLGELLSSEKYELEAVKGITKAVQRLRDVNFDCIVMAEDLPEIKGHDAVPVVKAICPEAPVIITSARNTPELESRIRQQNVFYYYVKSFDICELQMAVRDAFRKIGKEAPRRGPDRLPRILIVDDDRDFVGAMTTLLKKNSYEVVAAYNKKEAMEMVESARPDLVLLDIMMERLGDGVSICKKLKYDRELRHIPVLVVSSITEKTGFKVPTQAGGEDFAADDYVEKPVKCGELLRRVEKLLN